MKMSIKLSVLLLLLVMNMIFPLSSLLNISNKNDSNLHSIPIASGSIPVRLWNRTWGGSELDMGYGMLLDSSENVYIAGHTESFGVAGSDMCLVKFNTTGGLEWNRTWSGIGYDYGYGLALDSSENIYVAGRMSSFTSLNSEIWLVKFNSTGSVEWDSTWGGNESDMGYGIVLDSLGNAYISGWTESFGAGGSDVCLVKFNTTGGVEWNHTWGGNEADIGYGVAIDSEDNLYVAGYTESFGAGGSDMCLVKFNTTGGVEWNCTWGGSGTEQGINPIMDTEGNIYVAGHTESFGAGGSDMCLVKFNTTGGVEWNHTWGGNEADMGYGVNLDSEDNLYVAGSTESFGAGGSDMCLVKFNTTGGQEWNHTWGGNKDDIGLGPVFDAEGNFYFIGDTESYGAGNYDIYLAKFGIMTPPEPFFLSTDADTPDDDGIFQLNWTSSNGADNYSIYSSSNPITTLTGSETLIVEGIKNLKYMITETTNGTYYYIVVAYNEIGKELSNCVQVDVQIPEREDLKIPFDGMFSNYTAVDSLYGSGYGILTYSQISANLFHMLGTSVLWTFYWDVNPFTRIINNTGGDFMFVNGSHTPLWIFTDVTIGENILISIDGEGDHTFEVSDEVSITIPGYGILDAWKLIDLTIPGGIAIYEKNTGILLNGTFYYYGGLYNYTLTLTETNAIEKISDASKLIMICNAMINVRSSPGISDNIITTLTKGSIVQQIENEMNNIYVDGYHWVYVKFGIKKGWCAKEFLDEYNILNQNPIPIEDVLFTAYHVCYENEFVIGPTITNPQNIIGTFYKEFLYSARGVVMQGSGKAINGKTIKYMSGGKGWIDEEGKPTYYHSEDNTWRREDGTISPPYWIADEESVVFNEYPENVYIGSYWNVYPWYSIAVDKNIIPLGSIVYIEDLDGWSLLNGDKLNGYFMAADTGSAIVGNRIDMFAGAGQLSLIDWQEIQEAFSDKIDPFTNMLKMNITFDSITQWKIKEAKLKSPGELRIYDTENRTTGMFNGVIINEIPFSRYDHISNIIRIINPIVNFRYEILGTIKGNYGLEISFTENGNYIQFSASEIPILANGLHQFTVDWLILSTGGEGVRIQVDIDGDGEFDYDFYSDSELSQDEYLDAIQDDKATPIIPGYNLSILIGAFCLIILITKKQIKNHT